MMVVSERQPDRLYFHDRKTLNDMKYWFEKKTDILLYKKNICDELNLLNSFISLTILLASIKSSKAFGTFLIATLAFIEWSIAEHTTP